VSKLPLSQIFCFFGKVVCSGFSGLRGRKCATEVAKATKQCAHEMTFLGRFRVEYGSDVAYIKCS
jgi:hypothetical protein